VAEEFARPAGLIPPAVLAPTAGSAGGEDLTEAVRGSPTTRCDWSSSAITNPPMIAKTPRLLVIAAETKSRITT